MAYIQEIYPRDIDFVYAYYDEIKSDPYHVQDRGALPRWAVEAIYRHYVAKNILPANFDALSITSGFVFLNVELMQNLVDTPSDIVNDDRYVTESLTYEGLCVILDLAKR